MSSQGDCTVPVYTHPLIAHSSQGDCTVPVYTHPLIAHSCQGDCTVLVYTHPLIHCTLHVAPLKLDRSIAHGNLIALTVHALQQFPSLTSLADTNYSRLKCSMLEQWRVLPSLVTH